jgi:NADH dehydrogenase FAD-containing subunit
VGQLGVKADIETWAEFIDREASATSTDRSTVLIADARDRKDLEYAKPFQFLNLGVLAYIGASRALAQVSVDEKLILGSGPIGFLLWRGIYWSKQVSWRNRVLVTLDWIKAVLFGRDIGNL